MKFLNQAHGAQELMTRERQQPRRTEVTRRNIFARLLYSFNEKRLQSAILFVNLLRIPKRYAYEYQNDKQGDCRLL